MDPPSSFRELLRRYAAGERDFAESELDTDSDHDLRGVCLDGADLSRSFVVADFRRASLRNARFVGANVKTCDFRGADLTGADFRDAPVDAAEFEGATLEGATFAGASFSGHTFGEDERPI